MSLESSFSFLGEAGGITLEPNCLNSRADPSATDPSPSRAYTKGHGLSFVLFHYTVANTSFRGLGRDVVYLLS